MVLFFIEKGGRIIPFPALLGKREGQPESGCNKAAVCGGGFAVVLFQVKRVVQIVVLLVFVFAVCLCIRFREFV